jgi:hypothetical protein
MIRDHGFFFQHRKVKVYCCFCVQESAYCAAMWGLARCPDDATRRATAAETTLRSALRNDHPLVHALRELVRAARHDPESMMMESEVVLGLVMPAD